MILNRKITVRIVYTENKKEDKAEEKNKVFQSLLQDVFSTK